MPQAIKQIKEYKWGTIPHVKEIEQYLLGGDPSALAAIQKGSGNIWAALNLIQQALPSPAALTDMDRRGVHVLWQVEATTFIRDWLEQHLGKEKPGEDYHAALRTVLEGLKATPTDILDVTARQLRTFGRGGQPTSAGRYLLSQTDADLKRALWVFGAGVVNLPVLEFLAAFAPERLERQLDEVLGTTVLGNRWQVGLSLFHHGGKRFEEPIAAIFRALEDPWQKFQVGKVLAELDLNRYREEVGQVARACLLTHGRGAEEAATWLLKSAGVQVLPDLVTFLGLEKATPYEKTRVLSVAVQGLGKDALPALLAAIQTGTQGLILQALPHLIRFDDGAHEPLIRAELEKGLSAKDAATLNQFLAIAARGKVGPLAERLWELLGHSARGVRETAARALGTLGDEVVPRARELLEQGRSIPIRQGAVGVLTSAGTPAALKALEDRLDEEASDDVRDLMLQALEAAWAARGRTITRQDVEARIARAAPRLKSVRARWLDETKLPPLYYKDGDPLTPEAVRYLIYRQGRTTQIRPDVEARALYDLIDHARSGDFTAALLKQCLDNAGGSSIENWVVTLAALLGDDRVVALLAPQIRQWAESTRGKMAEYGVQALALLGSDAALLTVDSLALRYRTKKKNVGEAAAEAFRAAAERLGITTDELGDRVVPWLGFEAGKPRIIDCGGRRIEVRISPDFKLKYHDLDKNKPVASLPKTAPKEVQAQLKEAGALLREAVKAQLSRLENLMVRQQRWPAARWRELFLAHPVLLPFAVRLVWGAYDAQGKRVGLFRALEDRTLTTAEDEGFELPEGCTAGAVHPLEMSEDERGMWQAHLADYEIEPPFPQLERPVVHLPDSQGDVKIVTDYRGTSINALTFRGRAERLGWFRGDVGDGGCIYIFWKSFPAAGVDALIGVDGMYVGIGMNDEIRLEDLCFVRPGERGRRFYYGIPRDEAHVHHLALKEVPPVVYSEVMGDLQKIAGQKAAVESAAGVGG
jgi:hypothetical protein